MKVTFSPYRAPGVDVAGSGIVYTDRMIEDRYSKIAGVKILWQTSENLITATIAQGMINVVPNQDGTSGNALIAAYSEANEILWSWHIWVTPYAHIINDNRVDVLVGTRQSYNGQEWMDRNLGASNTLTPAVPELMYQWGRKDPFPLSNGISSNILRPLYDGEGDYLRSGTVIEGSDNQANLIQKAIAHPDVKILNCSLNTSHKYIRTYYARMYEAKFLTGVLAGALATQNKIGYVAQYPVYGTVANINAFALGAKFVNPRAKIYLKWSSVKGINIEEEFKKEDIHYISDQDMITPQCGSRRFGLYNNEGVGNRQHIAMPVWHWGVFYEKLIQSILGGSWKKDEDSDSGRALNYWWGMSSGVVDLICSNKVPVETRRLVELFRKVICNNEFEPFSDELYDQNRHLQNKKGHEMSPEDIITMDWLLDNVVGDIPAIDELDESARAIMVSQGITRE